jgi:hypothetical protein
MKKVLFLIAFVTVSIISNRAFAQTANVNITLSDVLSFSVTQPGSLDVNFNTEEKYNNGITSLATDHISVISSRGYVVKAIAGTVTGAAALAPGSVKLTPAIGATNTGNAAGITYGSAVTLPAAGASAATVITSTGTTWNGAVSTSKFNVSYLIGAGGTYAGKATGANVIPVVYTVTQQ